MRLHIAVCDDEQAIHTSIQSVAISFQMKHNIDLDISYFFTGQELITAYQSGKNYDIIFMDIEFPEENGIDTIQAIRKNYKRLLNTVFLTNYPQYMQDSFRVHAYNFLSKPISYVAFEEQILSIIADYFADETKITLLDANNNRFFININDILYIKSGQKFSYKNQLVFFTKDQMFHLRSKLDDIPELKQANIFCSINRGVYVNMMQINHLSATTLVLNNGTKLEVAFSKLKEFKITYNKYLSAGK